MRAILLLCLAKWTLHGIDAQIPVPTLHRVTKPVDHAEGPTWDSRKNLLYFVNIHAGGIYSYDFFSGKVHSIRLNGEVAVVIPSRSYPELLIVGINRTVLALEWDGARTIGRHKVLVTVSQQFPTSRFNDGKADKHGRLWFGTMGFEDSKGVAPNQGLLYKFSRKKLNNPEVMVAPVNISNGLTWNKANNKFYYIDTPTRKVVQYDYDDQLGSIKNPKTVFDVALHPSIEGFPDGMTIDEDDNLWIALYNGAAIIQVDPKSGYLLKIIAIPANPVTSVMWGGPDLDILFVTTSRFRLTAEERKKQPWAGSVFALKGLGTRGVETFEADVLDFVH